MIRCETTFTSGSSTSSFGNWTFRGVAYSHIYKLHTVARALIPNFPYSSCSNIVYSRNTRDMRNGQVVVVELATVGPDELVDNKKLVPGRSVHIQILQL
jgi:hypothetical protein